MAVIKSGRKRSSQPRRTASSGLSPSRRNWSKKETSNMPFSTAMPNSAMNPMAADTLSGIFNRTMIRIPPISAKGRFTRTSKALFMELNAENSIRKISRIEAGTTIANRRMARC